MCAFGSLSRALLMGNRATMEVAVLVLVVLLAAAAAAAADDASCCCCWCCCCCCCCWQLLVVVEAAVMVVVVEIVVVVVSMVVVEVEDGPALEEAGTPTAPTPGFVPTTSPVDNATATPGSFRLSSFSSSSLHFLPSFTFSATALLLNFLPPLSSPSFCFLLGSSTPLLPPLVLSFSSPFLFSFLFFSNSTTTTTLAVDSPSPRLPRLLILVDSLPPFIEHTASPLDFPPPPSPLFTFA